jgi:hypothetical protein
MCPNVSVGRVRIHGHDRRDQQRAAHRQFVVLYNASSEVLHACNPFKKKNPVTHLGFSIDQWIERIQTLLRMHLIQLLDGGVWVIEIRSGGAVHVFPGSPTPDGPIKK